MNFDLLSLNLIKSISKLKYEKELILKNMFNNKERLNIINREVDFLINDLEELQRIDAVEDEKHKTILLLKHIFKEPNEQITFLNNIKKDLNKDQIEKFKIMFDKLLTFDENNITIKETA